MKIYFFDTDTSDETTLRQLISECPTLRGNTCEVVFVAEALTQSNVEKAQDADVVSVFVNCTVDAALIEKLPKTRLIVTRSTGFDHIDLAKATEKGIVVCNIPAYGSRTVAEYAFSLILGLSRKTFAATRQIKNHEDFSITGFEGFNLQGKTLGIIGTGRIGLNAAMIAKGFDMKIIGFDAFPNTKAAADIGFAYVDFDTLLSTADVITVHVPYMKSTHHLLDDNAFGKMKKGVVVVNTSRGEVIDTEALMRALDRGTVGSAGLDVIEGEKEISQEWFLASGQQDIDKNKSIKILLDDHLLINRPNVFITPHIAFFSKEAKQEILQTTIADIESFAKGVPINSVK